MTLEVSVLGTHQTVLASLKKSNSNARRAHITNELIPDYASPRIDTFNEEFCVRHPSFSNEGATPRREQQVSSESCLGTGAVLALDGEIITFVWLPARDRLLFQSPPKGREKRGIPTNDFELRGRTPYS